MKKTFLSFFNQPQSLFWPFAIFILLLIFNAAMNPSFFTFVIKDGRVYGSLIDVALRASPLILVALGMTLVIATGGIDLSVGTSAALAGSVAALFLSHGLPFAVALLLALFSGVSVGLLNSFLIVSLGTQPIIASLISMVTGRGLAQLFVEGQIIPLKEPAYLWIGSGYFLGLPVVIWLTLLIFAGVFILVNRTAASLFIEALGSNARASHFIGLDTKLISSAVYVACGLLAAVGGIGLSANIRAVDVNSLGVFLELDAILAVVIGGTFLTGGRFSLVGSALGAIIIQLVTTTINTQGIAIEAMAMVKAAVVIIICLMQSEKMKNIFRRKGLAREA